MRRLQQAKIVELLKTLDEAHGELKKQTSPDAVLALLADCQDFAVQIGEYIESIEGEGTHTATLLEEYCDIVYTASLSSSGTVDNTASLSSGDTTNPTTNPTTASLSSSPDPNSSHSNHTPPDLKSSLKRLTKQMIKIENSVKNDLKPKKTEVVFFPYQLSMWDALESVYLAAKDDPDCDVYVVPIPYFEKSKDGMATIMHYDGDKYPDNIPITDWKAYDVETRCPDIAYIHYAYDDVTVNASVHPLFFSKRLREHTYMLVYVPYYVSNFNTVADYYGYLPGVCNSHRVIAQSEAIRQSFIGHYTRSDKQYGWGGQFGDAEEKFVALGSPKYDKVINAKREDFILPNEWERLIAGADEKPDKKPNEKPDKKPDEKAPTEATKKIILYNTHMFSWINGGQQYFEKIRHVFNTFKNRNDVVLWWRPHPNTEVNFRTQRPALLDDYFSVVNDYREGGWGIYDDTPDLHRAITCTDAYYGDMSSLVTLYHSTGKPVMIQNVRVTDEEQNKNRVSSYNLFDDGENLWFTAFAFNALLKMDKQTREIKYVDSFSDEDKSGVQLYGKITENNGKLFFSPFSAHEIAIYDVKAKAFEKKSIIEPKNTQKSTYMNHAKFWHIEKYGKYIYLPGCSYPAIARYDTETGKMDYFTDWVKHVDILANAGDVYFLHGYADENKLLLPTCNANAVVVFDMERCSSEVYEVGNKKNRYSNICFDGNDYWLMSRTNTPVVKWNPANGEYKEYDSYPNGFRHGDYNFCGICYANGFVWLFPYQANMALKIDVKTGEISIAEEFQPECEHPDKATVNFNYHMAKVIGDKMYAHTGKSNRLIEYDIKTKKLREDDIIFPEEKLRELQKDGQKLFTKPLKSCVHTNACSFNESILVKLSGYLDYVSSETEEKELFSKKQRELLEKRAANSDGTCGAKIHKYIKSLTQ